LIKFYIRIFLNTVNKERSVDFFLNIYKTNMSHSLIIDLYVKLINEYISLMGQSEILKSIHDKRHIVFAGLNALNHIFKINLVSTKNIETTYYYCEKAGYCYLEYIEQINKTDILTNLNVSDVLSFVYKENILHHNENPTEILSDNYPSNTFTNINILVNDELDNILYKMTSITNILLYWNNESVLFTDQQFICKNYLSNYLKFFIYRDYDVLYEYLAIILEKIKMKTDIYFEFIEEFYKRIVYLDKKNRIPNTEKLRYKIITFSSVYSDIQLDPVKGFVKTVLL